MIFASIGLAVVLITGGTYFFWNRQKASKEKEISDHYASTMRVTEDTALWQRVGDQWKECGEVYQNTILSFEDIVDEYYQIQGTDYFVSFDKVDATSPGDSSTLKSVLFPEDARIPANTILWERGEKRLKLDQELQLPIIEKQEEMLKVLLNEEVLEVKKEEVEVIPVEERQQETLEKVSIFLLKEEENLEEKLALLQERGYTYLTEEELLLHLGKNRLYPKNSVMLIIEKESDTLKGWIEKYHLTVNLKEELTHTYPAGDQQVSTLDNLTSYEIDKATTLERFQDMLEGKTEIRDVATSIAVLNYHFFYNPETGEECNESICLSVQNFEEQLKYLQDNGYRTLTMKEFNDWMDGKIELPKKSVLLTVDDGAMGTDTHLPALLEKYDAKATLFLISGWWPLSKYRLGNLELQSHGHDLHHNSFCRDGSCGKKGLILSKEELQADLQLSKETIGEPIAFCYPFYAYNQTLINAVKEEFELAFIGGNQKATRKSNKYKIPRYVIYKTTSLASFKNMIN